MSQHVQEPTMGSVAETMVEQRAEGWAPPSPKSTSSPFTGSKIITTSPNPPHPIREETLDARTLPSVIPPKHDHRTLIVCFDGTGDQFDADNSNIVQLVSLLKKNDRNKQMVYYQAGIGTYTPNKAATPFLSKMQKTLDEMFAWNLNSHVMGGYEFLMQNYIEGDKICIFGFSRGAYTARSLAGMLHKVGLLPASNHQQVPFAYKMYTRVDDVGWEQSNGFKKAFCIDVTIDFIGVWDTVDSVGLIPKRLPFTTSNTIVRTFRHALSLDERRAKFKANLWNRPNKKEETLGVQASQTTPSGESPPATPASGKSPSPSLPLPKLSLPSFKSSDDHTQSNGHVNEDPRKDRKRANVSESDRKLNHMERVYSSQKQAHTTDIEEVWFAGCHADVGGGSVSNKTRHSLARISLRWMVRECFKANTGIMFETEGLRQIGIDPTTLYPFVTPRPPCLPVGPEHKIRKLPPDPIPVRLTKKRQAEIHAHHAATPWTFLRSEEEEELQDSLSPIYDQLKLKRFWWVLEILPMQLRYQRGNNEWVNKFGSNLARPRFIPKQAKNGVKVHRSVKMRMEMEHEDENKKGKKYKPKPRLNVEPIWID